MHLCKLSSYLELMKYIKIFIPNMKGVKKYDLNTKDICRVCHNFAQCKYFQQK